MSSVKSDDSSKKDFCSNSVKSGTSSSDFSEDNYRQVFHDILVRGVPLEISEQSVQEELKRRRDVRHAYRVKNRSDDRPTTTFRVRLKSAEAKNHFLLNGIQIQGKPYRCDKFHHARIIRCFRCQQFGHAIEDCPSPTPICSKCSGKHKANDCRETVPRCVNCNGDHAAFDKECPAWLAYIEGRNVIIQQPSRPKEELREEPRDIPEFRPRQEYRQVLLKEPPCQWKPPEKKEPPAPVIVNASAMTRQDLDEVVDIIKEHITDELESFKTNIINTLNETLDQIRIEAFNNHQNAPKTTYPDSGISTQPYNSPQSSLAFSDLSSTSTVGPSMTSPGGLQSNVQHGCTFYSYRPGESQPVSYTAPTLEVPPQNIPVADYPQDMPYQTTTFYPPPPPSGQTTRMNGYYMPPHDRRLDLDEIRAELLKVNEAFFEKIRFAMK